MNVNETILAKKYAAAFLNIFSKQFSPDDYQKIVSNLDYFNKNRTFFFLLDTPSMSLTKKQEILTQAFTLLQLPPVLTNITDLLLMHHRITLLPLVCNQLVHLYEKRHKIVPFVITSATPLQEHQLTALQHFLAKKTQASIVYTFKINKKLIAGIRMQSDTYMWEHSIAKQLKELQKTIEYSKGY